MFSLIWGSYVLDALNHVSIYDMKVDVKLCAGQRDVTREEWNSKMEGSGIVYWWEYTIT